MLALSVLLSNSALPSSLLISLPESAVVGSGSGDCEAFHGVKSDPLSDLLRLTSDSSLNTNESFE